MDPMTMALIGTGIGVGGSLLGGLMGGQGSGNTEREAARRQIELAKNQSLINSQLMAPFVGYGNLAAQKLWGYGPVSGQAAKTGGTAGGTASVPYMTSTGNKWSSPTSIGYNTYGQTGTPFDRTGGAGKYMGQLEGLINNFQFDPNDPAYKYKTEESEKSVNRALAARGLFDSRAGVNMLTDADRAITADEYDKQYNRKYGGISDLFKMAGSLGETGYQSLIDAVKIGTGAGATAGQLGNAGASNLISSYGQMAQAGAQNSANNAQMWSGIGAMPMNAMILYNLLKGTGGGGAGVGMTGYGAN